MCTYLASPGLFYLFIDNCFSDLKETAFGLRMNVLTVKCLLYTDDYKCEYKTRCMPCHAPQSSDYYCYI